MGLLGLLVFLVKYLIYIASFRTDVALFPGRPQTPASVCCVSRALVRLHRFQLGGCL